MIYGPPPALMPWAMKYEGQGGQVRPLASSASPVGSFLPAYFGIYLDSVFFQCILIGLTEGVVGYSWWVRSTENNLG